ncbi:MAG: ABC transporter permease [Gemmatimonadota bacterium]
MSDGQSRARVGLLRAFGSVTEGVRIAIESIGANRVRSGLTMLGVGVGVAVVVLMAGLITGIRGAVQDGVESAGPRNLFVMRFDPTDVQLFGDGGRPPWWGRPPISQEEARRAGTLPAIESAVLTIGLQDPGAAGGITVEFGGTEVTGVQGAAESAQWTDYRPVTFVLGRNFVETEVVEGRSVVAISQQLATNLFGDQDPIGLRIRARAGNRGAVPLTVVGVFQTAESLFESQTAHIAVLPFTTALRRMGVSEDGGQMIVVPRPDVELEVAEDQLIGMFRSMRGLSPGEENDFAILRSTQILEFFDQLTGVFFIVMLALSSVGLLVGGVGVVGIMLISVTERTREIGVRKSLGATPREILWQFLVEASVLTIIGGAIGLILGSGLAWAVQAVTPVPAEVPLWAIAVSLLMAALTGMLFGLAPAARAARMDPVVALRFE